MTLKRFAELSLALAFAFLPLTAEAADISGAGATFPYPVYAKWAEAYNNQHGITMNYQSIGSGGGVKQIKARTVDFGATDAPMKPADLKTFDLIQFPTVMGAIVPIVNLDGIKPGEMVLTGAVLADIYLGKITKWNDPALVALNKDLPLPASDIAVVHRSDGSGTTFNFTYYLNATNPAWGEEVGVGKAVAWPAGLGGKGNEGVASLVGHMSGAIGYVEHSYAHQNHMTYTRMINKDGKIVEPTLETIQAAAANADWAHAEGNYLILANQPGRDSWPMTAATFILMHKKQDKREVGKAVVNFFTWAFDEGDTFATDLAYVPMPDKVVTMNKSLMHSLTDKQGAPLFDLHKTKAEAPAQDVNG
ncbi:MAG: phosphate ABC transporter substrate-binding protein PstS [Parvibaculum sp.]|nr:phosphate ABC transporter substrate-binding protein PstS [Parvibaculum sp.]